MNFVSVAYLVFVPVVLLVYWAVPAARRVWVLLAASYVFYGAWDVRFLVLVWISTAVDFVVATRLGRTDDDRQRRTLLWVSMGANLGILGFFKYAGFFVDSGRQLLERIGLEGSGWTLEILLPVGISFYTFQTLSYTIDIYRRRAEPETHLPTFALYVAYFPQLVAGPIERASRLLPQLAALPGRVPGHQLASGLRLIMLGLVQKAVLADMVAPHVNAVYADPSQATSLGALVGIVGFSVQIYGDFAGYSNIARGTSRLLGVELMVNFTEPYRSKSITEFWRRWHISLSDWLRDYLYIPLGGNRCGPRITQRNLLLTMLLGGLWHGAAWTFVAWGALHGTYLLLERNGSPEHRRSALWVPFTFALVSLTWIPFRAASFGDAVAILEALGSADWSRGTLSVSAVATVAVAAGLMTVIDGRLRSGAVLQSAPGSFARGFAYGTAAAAVLVATATSAEPFLYFQF
ncbi:MAG: MBOAT family O-acyltransferase [Acidimicrobiales bacterium]